MNFMSPIYASLYKKGLKQKNEIPVSLHEEVSQILAEEGIEFK